MEPWAKTCQEGGALSQPGCDGNVRRLICPLRVGCCAEDAPKAGSSRRSPPLGRVSRPPLFDKRRLLTGHPRPALRVSGGDCQPVGQSLTDRARQPDDFRGGVVKPGGFTNTFCTTGRGVLLFYPGGLPTDLLSRSRGGCPCRHEVKRQSVRRSLAYYSHPRDRMSAPARPRPALRVGGEIGANVKLRGGSIKKRARSMSTVSKGCFENICTETTCGDFLIHFGAK